MAFIFIPFAVFFVCGIAQFWFLKRVRDRLIDKHPEAFLATERASIFPGQGAWRFTKRSRYKALGDEELNKRVRNLKRLYLIAFLAWAALGVAILTAPTR